MAWTAACKSARDACGQRPQRSRRALNSARSVSWKAASIWRFASSGSSRSPSTASCADVLKAGSATRDGKYGMNITSSTGSPWRSAMIGAVFMLTWQRTISGRYAATKALASSSESAPAAFCALTDSKNATRHSLPSPVTMARCMRSPWTSFLASNLMPYASNPCSRTNCEHEAGQQIATSWPRTRSCCAIARKGWVSPRVPCVITPTRIAAERGWRGPREARCRRPANATCSSRTTTACC
mmetsp:Transcript_43607/g.134733  ORF Transcript_43607/g.134733 Transcript_43607/m.134733 type:complete len:241 (-) Transcript_43607:11-733(-)